jgi:hypothetical protein
MAMPYPPPLPLPVPAWMPSVPESLPGHDLASIGLMNPEEELSNQQLNFTACLQHNRSSSLIFHANTLLSSHIVGVNDGIMGFSSRKPTGAPASLASQFLSLNARGCPSS